MREAMEVLDNTAIQIVLVVESDKKLCGVVTDGDIRRALLAGKSLEAPVKTFMTKDPLRGSRNDSRDMLLGRMRSLGVHHMPLVDDDGSVIDFVTTDPLGRRDNRVVLMAGGMGMRLRPLTNDVPKPMLRVGDRPILETIIGQFREFGFGKFSISLNYLAEQIEAYFEDGSRWGVDINYLHENEPLGTAGALSLLKERPKHPFIMMNGDLLTKLNFDKLMKFHEAHSSPLTICAREYSYNVPYGVMETNGDYLERIHEKPQRTELVNAGIYVIDPEVLDYIQPDERIDITDVIEKLINDNRKPCVFPVHEYWIDIGQKHDIERAIKEFSEIFVG